MVVALLALLNLLVCAGEQHDTESADSPWAWPDDGQPIPTDERWPFAFRKFMNQSDAGRGFQRLKGEDLVTRIEFLRTYGFWFCVVISRRNDSTGVCRTHVGWLRGDELGHRYIGEGQYALGGHKMDEYLHLVETDSLWTLFGEYGFWNEEDWWETAYANAGQSEDGAGQWTGLFTLKDLSQRGSSPDASRGLRGGQTETDWLTVSYWLLRDVSRTDIFQDSAIVNLTQRQEVFVNHGSRFAGIFSRRNTQIGAYSAVVGQHLGDSVVYRWVIAPRQVTGNELERYLDLVKRDSLWFLVGSWKLWQDESGLERLWNQPVSTLPGDSNASDVMVLRFASPSAP